MLPFKQARRREDDISIVTAGIRIKLAVGDHSNALATNAAAAAVTCPPAPPVWVIADTALAYGGMAPVT